MSSDEIFDVVNERDEVTGQRTRGEVHRLGLLHRAVHVLVFNRAGEVFLQKRSMTKDCSPGLWDSSASGHLEAGEDWDDCAVREMAEELGVASPRPPDFLFKEGAGPETGMEFIKVYRAAHEGPFELHPGEIETGGWFAPTEVDARTSDSPGEFAPAFVLLWKRFRATCGRDAC